jgi:hypothetical protein
MALTELKSTLSNFRKPMPENPLIKKGADKVTPIKATDKDLTLSKTSNLGAKDVNKSQTNLSNTKFNSNIKTSKMGVFDSFITPDINKNVSIVKEKTSNIQVVKSTQGLNNNTSTIKTISVNQNKLLQIMNSGLDIDSIPVKYTIPNTLTQDTSNFNLDYTPPKYINTPTALRFGTAGTGLLLGASNLDIDSIPNKYQNIIGSGQFIPFKVAQSNLDVNSIPNKYINIVGLGKFDPFNSTQSGFDINNIPTKYQNIVGLGKFDPFKPAQSNFDINNIPTKYQNIVGLGQFDPFKIAQSQLDVNSIPAKYQNIVGLGKFTPFNPVQSQLDINGIPNKYSNIIGNGQFNDDNTIIGNRWRGNIPPAVNFFAPDTNNGAKGFTTNMTNTQFNFINGNQYSFTNTIEIPLSNGVAKLDSQLGLGSRFNYTDGGVPKSKVFSVAGYSSVRKYGDIVKSNKQSPDDSLLYKLSTEENSPSALDLQYAKFNLQDDSYNPFYINQPFILRGIQRKGNKSPQRWGGSSLADDGFIRGGIAAAVERSAFDVARLAQWAATPKGLLWVTKQVGLGLTNAFVQHTTPLVSQTRLQTGLTSLLSVPTTAFGLHFTRHGAPFANNIDDYGTVQEFKNTGITYDSPLPGDGPGTGNRLLQLHGRFISDNNFNAIKTAQRPGYLATSFGGTTLGQLFGTNPIGRFGGPNSVYGIGFTKSSRVVDTTKGSSNFTRYNINSAYTNITANVESAVLQTPGLSPTISSTDYESPLYSAGKNSRNPASNIIFNPLPNPFQREFDIQDGNNSSKLLQKGQYDGNAGTGDIRNYATLTYGNIRKLAKNESDFTNAPFKDFRHHLDNSIAKKFSTDPDKADYQKNNLEKQGWGTQGAVGADRSDYTKASGRGDKVNLIDYEKRILSRKLAKGDYSGITPNTKDFIAFYFSGPLHHLGSEDDTIIFRANIQGFTDSFSPEWATIPIMGRADKAYIYTGFERSISFTFTVAATSREELKPMWRKINYLSTYTMPDYSNGRLVGPFMRITIGNLFQNTPVFIESLNISIPDDATWETNLDGDPNMKQLPTMVEISVTLKYLGDYRPKKIGRAYSLSKFGEEGPDSDNWLPEAE